MSSNQGGSSSSVHRGERYEGLGVAKRCWCGEVVVNIASHSNSILNVDISDVIMLQRNILSTVFKWLDEALIEECDALTARIGSFEEAHSLGLDYTERMGDDMLLEAKLEARRGLQMMIIVVVIGFIVSFGLLKLV